MGDCPCPSAVSLQYICSASAVSTSCAMDRPAVHKGKFKNLEGPVKYPLKCSEVCFEVRTSLHWDCTADRHGWVELILSIVTKISS